MPPTYFIPNLNGVQGDSFKRLKGLGPQAFAALLRRTRLSVTEALREKYFGAVDIYRLDYHLERWNEAAGAERIGREAGLLYLILDFFHARLFPRQAKERYLSTTAFASYFWQRSADNLENNAAGLLHALAVAGLLPDEWFPQVVLERRIQAEIGRLRVFEGTQVSSDLGLPTAGVSWMGQETRVALAAIQAKLAAGEPCLARMIRDPSRLSANRQVIAYDCVARPGPRLRLSIYETGCLCSDHAIEADLSEEKPVLVETCSPNEPMPVFGLLCEHYAPASPPEASAAPWLRNQRIRSWYWRLRYGLHRVGFQ
jgi:hypothetical protein